MIESVELEDKSGNKYYITHEGVKLTPQLVVWATKQGMEALKTQMDEFHRRHICAGCNVAGKKLEGNDRREHTDKMFALKFGGKNIGSF